jgi:hypothetical protein
MSKIILVILLLLLCACSNTDNQLATQELKHLVALRQSYESLETFLQNNPQLKEQNHIELFYSENSINSILSVVDDSKFPIKSIDAAYFRIVSIRTDFEDGYPRINAKVVAEKENLEIMLSVTARMIISELEDDPDNLIVQIDFSSVVPHVSWWFFQFELKGFVADLLKVEANEYMESLPRIYIPIKNNFEIVDVV